MVRRLAVTFETRKPLAAAFEFDSDDVEIAVIVSTSSLGVDINAIYEFVMDQDRHDLFLNTPKIFARRPARLSDEFTTRSYAMNGKKRARETIPYNGSASTKRH